MASIRKRAPVASSATVRRVMQANRSGDTGPEVRLRSTLHRLGFRFRKDHRPVPELKCKADIVFPSIRLCVFVDGCYWHRCPKHFSTPKANSEWWDEKINANCERDALQTRELKKRGWKVIRVWEHQVSGATLDVTVSEIRNVLSKRLARKRIG